MARISAPERRAALVRAALNVVADRGVSAATTRAIVAEAHMSLASFHYAFSSHDELMAQLVEFVVDQQERAIQPVLTLTTAGSSMRDAVRSGLQNYFEVLRLNPSREKAMFELTHYAMRSPGLERLAERQYASYYSLAERALSSAAEAIGVEWDAPIHEVAALLVVFTDGLTLSWLVNRDDRMAESTMDFAADSIGRLARRNPLSVTRQIMRTA